MFGTGNKVAERVVFMFLLARAIPRFAQLAAAAHMGNGKRHAALKQTQACMGKPRVKAFAIGAVTIQIQRCRFAQRITFHDQADGHLSAIRRSGPQTLADIVIGIERPKYRRFLKDLLFAIGQCQLADLRRAIQRFVTQADVRTLELKAVLHIQAVGCVW